MAHTIHSDSTGKYIKVVSGDTLSEIAVECKSTTGGKTYKQLADLNNIKDPNLIYVGQKIYLTKTSSGSGSGSSSKPTSNNGLKIEAFGLSASDREQKTLFAVWSCKLPHINKYSYEWHYTTGDKTDSGSVVWYRGNSGELEPEETNVTSSIPNGAKKIRFRVKPLPTEFKASDNMSDTLKKTIQKFITHTDSLTGEKTYKSFQDQPWTYPTDSKGNTKYHDVTPAPPEASGTISHWIDHETKQLNVEIRDYDVKEPIDAGVDSRTSEGFLKNTKIEIQVIANDKTEVISKTDIRIQVLEDDDNVGFASWKYAINTGNKYKVRYRAVRGVYESEWSAFTDNASSAPAKVTGLKVEPVKSSITDQVDLHLEWNVSTTAKKYSIQYLALDEGVEAKFDGTNNPDIKTQPVDDPKPVNGKVTFILTNVDIGKVYHFRIAAVDDEAGNSDWSEVVGDIVVGESPGRPFTWASADTISLGEDVYLYWQHSSKDGSKETSAHILIESFKIIKNDQDDTDTEVVVGKEDVTVYKRVESVDVVREFFEVVDGVDERIWSDEYTVTVDKDQTSFYQYKTDDLTHKPWLEEGVTLRYSIQTTGVTNKFGEWSDTGYIKVYSQPELTFTVKPHGSDIAYNSSFVCSSFPLTINATSGPSTQSPTGYYVSIVSNDIYETVDNVGRNKTVSVGDIVYSKYFDVSNYRDIEDFQIGPSDVNLDNGVSYTIECVVSMNSGLSAQHSIDFNVVWTDDIYSPLAQVIYDPETFTANIRPYCENYITSYYRVRLSGLQYQTTTEKLNHSWGQPLRLPNGKIARTSDTNDIIYTGITTDDDGNYMEDEVLFYEVDEGDLVQGVTLSVYRREYDGRFTEIATGIDNTKNTFVIDPHPALDYARYRIVAMSNETGAISYTDIPGVPIGEPGIIIQWDEEWGSYDFDFDITDELSKPNWAGSLLRLPYNVDVSPSYSIDTTLIEYIGREHPVSYYGTQLGETATWNTVIPKEDKETIYALHRLAKWPGNVYAREPSGVGYWAHVSVQFPQKHLEKTIAVSISLTRVEGGM